MRRSRAPGCAKSNQRRRPARRRALASAWQAPWVSIERHTHRSVLRRVAPRRERASTYGTQRSGALPSSLRESSCVRERKCLTCSCARTRKSGSAESRPGGLVKAGRLRGLAAGPLADGPQRVILRRERALLAYETGRPDNHGLLGCERARRRCRTFGGRREGVGRSGLFWHRRVRARRRRLRLADYLLVDPPGRRADFKPGDEIGSSLSEDSNVGPGPVQIFSQRRADVDRPAPKSTHRRRASDREFASVNAPLVRTVCVLSAMLRSHLYGDLSVGRTDAPSSLKMRPLSY